MAIITRGMGLRQTLITRGFAFAAIIIAVKTLIGGGGVPVFYRKRRKKPSLAEIRRDDEEILFLIAQFIMNGGLDKFTGGE